MNIFSLFSAFGFYIYLTLAIYVLLTNRKSKENIIFFLMCISLTIWALAGFFGYSSIYKKGIILWIKIGLYNAIFFYTLALHFCIELTDIIKLKKIILFIFYALSIILCFKVFFNLFDIYYSDIIKINNIWNFKLNFKSVWSYLLLIYCYISLLIRLILLYSWYKKDDLIRIKKQAKILFITLLIAEIIASLENLLIPLITSYNSHALAPLFLIIWMFGITYAIAKYKFLSISPETVSRDVLANIDEAIILLDRKSKIILINHRTEIILNKTSNELNGKQISEIIFENNDVSNEIQKLIKKKYNSFSCRVNFIKTNNEKILMDTKFSVVKDKFNDIIGILIIGREVKEMKQLKTLYQITDREADVIQHIIYGATNKEIADQLNIAERTIKTHITNIYNKLGVDNKIQLMHLLKDFNLIPEQNSDKTVLFFNK